MHTHSTVHQSAIRSTPVEVFNTELGTLHMYSTCSSARYQGEGWPDQPPSIKWTQNIALMKETVEVSINSRVQSRYL